MLQVWGHIALSFLYFLSSTSAQSSPSDLCPIQCRIAGDDPTKWTHIFGEPALKRCQEPVLFDTAISIPVDDQDSITLRSCTASAANTTQQTTQRQSNESVQYSTLAHSKLAALAGCNANSEGIRNKTAIHILEWKYGRDGVLANKSEIVTAVQKLRDYLRKQPECKSTAMSSQFRGAVVGLYVGAEVLNTDADIVVDKLLKAIDRSGEVSALASEVCRDGDPVSWNVGVYADFRGNISATQAAIGNWVQGRCLSGYDSKDARE